MKTLARWIELILIFVVAPGVLSYGPRWMVLPSILVGGFGCLIVLLCDGTFSRRHLLDGAAARRGLSGVLARTLAVGAALVLFAIVTRGLRGSFLLPRERPVLWLALMVLYPVFSVYPQEIMFRAFFFHRYGALFRRPAVLLGVNAVLFGWAHVVVHNVIAIALTTVGGLLLSWTYYRSRSTLLVAIEHALYGNVVLSVGVGGMFVNGVRLLAKAMG